MFKTMYEQGTGMFGQHCQVHRAVCSGMYSFGGGSDSGMCSTSFSCGF